MAAYGLLDILLGCVASAAIACTSVALVLCWHPLLEQVGNSCKAGNTHPKRRRLLWLVALGLLAWLLTLLIYIRNCYALWQLWTNASRNGFADRVVCTSLEVFFIFIVVWGALGSIITICVACMRIQELKELIMILNFSPNANTRRPDHRVPSTLSQRSAPSPPPTRAPRAPIAPSPRSPSPPSATTVIELSDFRMTRVSTDHSTDRTSRQPYEETDDTDPQPTSPSHEAGESSWPQRGNRHPIERQFHKGAYYMQIAKDEAYSRAARDNGSEVAVDTHASSSSGRAGESSSLGADAVSANSNSCHHASPRTTHPPYPSPNINDVDEYALSRCSSCSESHTSTIPHTRRASVREPLTPTTPSRDFGDAANPWAEIGASGQHLSFREAHASQLRSLLAGIEERPAGSAALSEASTMSDVDDTFQDPLERLSWEITGPPNSTVTAPSGPSLGTDSDLTDPLKQRFQKLKGKETEPKNATAKVGTYLERGTNKTDENHKARPKSPVHRQQPSRTDSQGQKITSTLAIQRGIRCPPLLTAASSSTSASTSPHRGSSNPLRPTRSPSPYFSTTPSHSSSSRSPGRGSNVPNAPPPSPRARQPPRPRRVERVFTDTKYVASNDRPSCKRILSPRLRAPDSQHESEGSDSASTSTSTSGQGAEEAENKQEEDDFLYMADHPSGNGYW